MSRQEDFIDAGIAYRMEHGKPMCIAGSNLADVERDFNRVISFEAGAEHGYQYAKKRICNALRKRLMLFTNDENERILPPLALELFIADVVKEVEE